MPGVDAFEEVFEIVVTECALVEPIQESDAGLIGNAWLCHGDYGHAHGYNPKIELVRDKTTKEPYPWAEKRGIRVCQHARSEGVLLRPLGSVIVGHGISALRSKLPTEFPTPRMRWA